jgi:hypothetical protein
VTVQLQALPASTGDRRVLEIGAQVTGAQAGLRYKWFSVAGECDPQESERPATAFRFAGGTKRDRVTVEVWRDDRRVAHGEIDVALDERLALLAMQPAPNAQVEVTTIPAYEPEGGPDTRADIAGRVSGELPSGYHVVIYARADAWYNQPTPYATHSIRPDGTWSTWTHTGSSYAALVVRAGYAPYARLDVLPPVGGEIVARTIVEGIRR